MNEMKNCISVVYLCYMGFVVMDCLIVYAQENIILLFFH